MSMNEYNPPPGQSGAPGKYFPGPISSDWTLIGGDSNPAFSPGSSRREFAKPRTANCMCRMFKTHALRSAPRFHAFAPMNVIDMKANNTRMITDSSISVTPECRRLKVDRVLSFICYGTFGCWPHSENDALEKVLHQEACKFNKTLVYLVLIG